MSVCCRRCGVVVFSVLCMVIFGLCVMVCVKKRFEVFVVMRVSKSRMRVKVERYVDCVEFVCVLCRVLSMMFVLVFVRGYL